MENNNSKKFGFIQMCADKRFHAIVEAKFQEITGLKPDEYWIEATAGGSPAVKSSTTTDYAHAHGALIMGWAAHGSHCGGYPDVSDAQMSAKLDEVIKDRRLRYPDAIHYRIFSSETETICVRVK
jgi:hypothetical protein